MKNIILTLLCIMAFEANAQVADNAGKISPVLIKKDTLADNASKRPPYYKPRSFLPAIILVGIGASSFVIKPVRNFDYYVRARIAASDPNYNSKAADYLQLAPGVLVYALNLVGDEGKNRFVDRTALVALSGLILTGADGLKFVAHRVRPYGTDPLSFPSGHTGAAFLAAEFLVQEYSDKSIWYSVLGYGMATTTGILRLYGRAHWFSDVVAGAGLGMLSTKAAYLVYPYIRRAFTHTDKYGRTTSFMPTYQYGAPGVSFAMQL